MLTIKNLKKQYDDFSLKIDSLEFESNQIYALLGVNGAGKTTILKCIIGIKRYEGDVLFEHQTVLSNREQILNNLGYVGDTLEFNGDLTVNDFFEFTKSIYDTWDESQFQELLSKLTIKKYLTSKINALSKGTELKVALAACLSRKPRYLFLDEPTSGLDISVRQEVMDLLLSLKNKETMILFSTHIMEDVEDVADVLINIDDGEVILNDSLKNIKKENPGMRISDIILNMNRRHDHETTFN